MRHDATERHTYRGSRDEAERLIAWLIERNYWGDFEVSSDAYSVTCGVQPEIITEAVKRGELKLSF